MSQQSWLASMSASSCGSDEGLGRAVARLADVVDLGAMHADDVEEGLAVDVEAGAGAALALDAALVERRGGGERRATSGDARRTADRPGRT